MSCTYLSLPWVGVSGIIGRGGRQGLEGVSCPGAGTVGSGTPMTGGVGPGDTMSACSWNEILGIKSTSITLIILTYMEGVKPAKRNV